MFYKSLNQEAGEKVVLEASFLILLTMSFHNYLYLPNIVRLLSYNNFYRLLLNLNVIK